MQFIPLLEETRMILDVGAWALKRAVLDHQTWVDRGLVAPRIAVNVSAIQMRQKDFVDVVVNAIGSVAQTRPIDLELTESLLMTDMQGNIEKLNALRALGLKIAIDDFGTGHSSLKYLAQLPVDTLKIDRSFIITMFKEPSAKILTQTIISLAHSLDLSVVAEGVDSEEQARFLKVLRCDQMQGYLFSKPLPMAEMTALLEPGNGC
jgi:EAL domain-containing protein (putative c-di-GMP-specific phosphodiesterase class I)